MRIVKIILLSSAFLAMVSCGPQLGGKKHNTITPASQPNLAEGAQPLDTSVLPKASLTLVPSFLRCRNLGAFMESYQRRYLPDYHLVLDGDCLSSSGKTQVVRSIEIATGDTVVATIGLALTASPGGDLDKKPEGVLLVSWQNNITGAMLRDLSLTFVKWVEENALTPRDACLQLSLDDAQCLKRINASTPPSIKILH